MGCDVIEDIGDSVSDVFEGVKDFAVDVFHEVGDLFQDLLDIPNIDDLQDALNENNGVLINQSSNIKKLPVVYGQRKLGGVRTFVGVPPADSTKLHIVLALCEGEINAIDDVYIDDVISTDPSLSGLVTVYKYTGTTTQNAHSQLEAHFPNVNASEDLKGVAAVHVVLTADPDVFSSFPRINCVVRGLKVLDVRDSTEKYSANPALAVYDYLTDSTYGKGLATTDLDTQSFIDAANYCDTTFEEYSGSGTTIAYFETNAYLDTSKKILDNVNALLSTFRGHLPFIGGKYTLIVEKDETSAFTFTEDNIIEGSWNFGGTSKRLLLNKVKVVFINPDKNWQSDMRTLENATYLTEDNGFELSKEINLIGETNQYRADYIAQTLLKKSRQGISVSFVASLEALQVQVGDVVQITHPTPGWTNKKFRVVKARIFSSGNVGFSLVEHEPTVYDRTVPAGVATPPDTDLPNPYEVSAITGLAAASGTDQLVKGSDGTIITRVKLTWTDPSNPFIQQYEFQYKLTSDSNWTNVAPQVGQSTEAFIAGLADGSTYDIRARYKNTFLISSPWATIQHTVIGKTEAPPDVEEFFIQEQNDGTRQFSWSYENKPVDHGGYLIKYSFGTGGTWDNMIRLHEDLIQSSPWETNLLLAGSYTFAIKAIDTTGNECANPLYIETNLGDPRLTESIDIQNIKSTNWPGTKTNCFINENNELEATGNDWDDLTTWDAWTGWNEGASTTIIYEHTVYDVGKIATFKPIVSVFGVGFYTIEERHSDDDITYTAWTNADGSEITARYIQIRITATDASGPTIEDATLNISAKPLIQDTEDLDISTLTGANRIATGHVKIPLTKSFNVVKGVVLTLQNVGAGWSVELISKADLTNGPEVKIYNSSNTLADATIDAQIRGA